MTSDLFCRMQFNDAEKLGRSYGFLDPQRIAQLNMVVKYADDSEELKGKSKKEKSRIVKEEIKRKKEEMSVYIGRAFLEHQGKTCIFAPYNFK